MAEQEHSVGVWDVFVRGRINFGSTIEGLRTLQNMEVNITDVCFLCDAVRPDGPTYCSVSFPLSFAFFSSCWLALPYAYRLIIGTVDLRL